MATVQSTVQEISDSEFEELLNDSPKGTPGKDDLLGGKKEEVKIDNTKKTIAKEDITKLELGKAPQADQLETFNEEDLDDTEGTTDVTTELPIEKESKRGRPAKTESPIDYKSATEYLIEKGIWEDFDGKESIEYTDKTFAELLEAQAHNKANVILEDKVNSLGEVAKQIIEFEKNGGDPKLIIEAFQEQRDIESFDIDSEDGQESIIREYYSRAGKQKQWIDKQINLLKEQGEDALKEEAVENQKLILDEIGEEVKEAQVQQVQLNERRKVAEQQFNSGIRKFIHEENIPDRDKKAIEQFYFDYKYQLPNGQKVNELYKKWIDIQNDPKKYYQFVKWAFNPESFADVKETTTKINKATFNFLKGSQDTNSKKTSADTEYQETNKTKHKNPFSFKI